MNFQLIIFLINICLILSIVFIERKNPSEALLWVAILTVLPIVGIFFYLILGSTVGFKLTYIIRNKKLENKYKKEVVDQLSKLHKSLESSNLIPKASLGLMRFNLNYSNSLLTNNNEIKQLVTGKDNYENLFKDIDNAKSSIHIQFYSIHNDELGKELVKHLTEKSLEGVNIKVLYDGIGSITTPKKLFKPLVEAGGLVKKVKPFFTQYRNHRKIVVIDGLIGYTGGMNVGKQYAGMHKVKKPWRDTQIRILGDAVYMLQYHFLLDWIYETKHNKDSISSTTLMELFPSHTITNNLPCQIVTGGVNTNKEFIKMSYLKLISSAKEKIFIQSPYFVPDKTLLDALKVAAASGIDISIMLPGIKSSFFLEPTGNYYISELIEYGVKVYRYNGYIHSKTLSIDDNITCIGSVNMDMRSLLVNDEICCFIYDNNFSDEYKAIYENDINNSTELDYEKFKNRSISKRVIECFFRLFAPIM